MNAIIKGAGVEDFNHFCKSFDVRSVIATAEDRGHAAGLEKEVYAMAILRALHNGDFGEDRDTSQKAISALWNQGHYKGFNAESFNEIFQQVFVYW